MTTPQIEIQIIAILTAIACALPGVFLVLRKMALISDAISHSILLGIVIGFFVTQDLNSPLLVVMAAIVGVLTVVLVELIQKTGLVKEDTAIGLVFPALFSVGVILIAKNANDIHIDVDAVLVGDLVFAPFDRWYWGNIDLGPKSLWIISGILVFSVSLFILFYKELKISTFDPGLAAALGISPALMHYALMSVSSITIVGAFDAVGAILVVALMIVPAATAYLLTNQLKKMILLSVGIGVFAAITGYRMAIFLDASIAGSMASVLGIIFLITYLFAPNNGLLATWYKQKRQKRETLMLTLLLHLHSLNKENDLEERKTEHLIYHFSWTPNQAKKILQLASENGLIEISDNLVYLTEKGSEFGGIAIDYIISNRNEKIEGMKEDFLLFRG